MIENNKIVWLGADEDMEDVKAYFKEDPTIESFVFPKYYQVYRRKISSSMVKAMFYLYRWHQQNGFDKWCKLSDYISQFKEPVVVCSGDNPKLRHWGLIEMKSETDGDVRDDGSDRTGYYKLTQFGNDFLHGKIVVHEFLFICNKEVIGKSETNTNVKQCIKNKFDFREILNK